MKKTTLVIILLVFSCSYRVLSPVYESISVGRIENKTFEHGLEDRLTTALVEELMRNGIKVDKNSPYKIEGTIDRFELKGIAQKDEISVQFMVFIEGDFVLRGPEGKERRFRASTILPQTFSSEGALEEVLSLKESTINSALKDMAQEIVSGAVFR